MIINVDTRTAILPLAYILRHIWDRYGLYFTEVDKTPRLWGRQSGRLELRHVFFPEADPQLARTWGVRIVPQTPGVDIMIWVPMSQVKIADSNNARTLQTPLRNVRRPRPDGGLHHYDWHNVVLPIIGATGKAEKEYWRAVLRHVGIRPRVYVATGRVRHPNNAPEGPYSTEPRNHDYHTEPFKGNLYLRIRLPQYIVVAYKHFRIGRESVCELPIEGEDGYNIPEMSIPALRKVHPTSHVGQYFLNNSPPTM